MKLYFAGNTGEEKRERILFNRKSKRLYSFFYHSDDGEFACDFERRRKYMDEPVEQAEVVDRGE